MYLALIFQNIIVFIAYQPSLELLRQMLSQGGTYDRQRQEFQDMEEATFLAATTVPSVAGVYSIASLPLFIYKSDLGILKLRVWQSIYGDLNRKA